MLQDPFYKGMQRKTEAILEGHLEKAHHLGHLNNIGGQYIRGPNLNAKWGPVSRPDSRFDPIDGYEPSSGCETQDWDSLPDFFFFKSQPVPVGMDHIL